MNYKRSIIITNSILQRNSLVPEKHILSHPATYHHVLSLPLKFCHSQSAKQKDIVELKKHGKRTTESASSKKQPQL